MSLSGKRTLVVGLDAACWEYLDPLLASGQLPTLQGLMDAGAPGTLRSTLPALTATAWSSIVTGKNPGKHGVFGMTRRQPGSYHFEPINARSRSGTPFWTRLNDAGVRVGLVNIPFTHPPDALDGFVVAGFGAPSSAPDLAYPPHVLPWIESRFGDYVPEVGDALFQAGASPSEILVAERAHQERQVQIAISLAARHDIDVLAINLMLLDHANHYMPHMDQVQEAIRQCDAHLAQLIDGFSPDNLMLFSDHGSRRVRGGFLLYNWLLDHGYCAQLPRSASERRAATNWVLVQWLQHDKKWTGLAERAGRRVGTEMLTRLPTAVAARLWEIIERDFPFAQAYVSLSDRTDYSGTRVFLDPGGSRLYINLRGREREGIVSLEQRASITGELVDDLMRIPDPVTQQPLFSGLHRPEALYSGPAVDRAPDLVLDAFGANWHIVPAYYEPVSERLHGRYFTENKRSFGWHSRDGVFVFSGQDLRSESSPAGGGVMDIAPTILYLCGVPIPADYDGRVLSEAIAQGFLDTHPVTHQSGDAAADLSEQGFQYADDDVDELMDRLRALGYVE